ncbi:MAG: pilus assembly PilX N-terminal domain-containing protein [Actinomycetes bacterium]
MNGVRKLANRVGRGGGTNDSGLALVVVLAVTTMLTLLLVAATGFAVNQMKQTRSDQDWQAALAAAEGGVDEYVSRLNADGGYWRYGNPGNSYSSGSSVTLPTGATVNSAFSGWTTLPGVTNSYFRYDVDTSQYLTTGIIKLRSSGKVGVRIRTIEVQLKRRSFIDFLYFTNYEEKDPAAYSYPTDSYTPAQAAVFCANKHHYEGRVDAVNGVSTGCSVINFGGGDKINGPMHTNDSFYVCGNVTFASNVTTSYSPASGSRYIVNTGCGTATPSFAHTGDPSYAAQLVMPPSNTSIRQQVDPTYTSPPGCLYTGPTRIVLNSNKTMAVTSPWTKNGGAAYCGVGASVPIPTNGVVYVQNVPATADAYTTGTPANGTCANDYGLGFPISGDITAYNCKNGDVFIEGTLSGQLTVAAEDNIDITWNITYAGGASGTDLLGLVANNYVEIYHPVKLVSSTYSNLNVTGQVTAFTNPTIWAAILSVQHSFRVQNYDKGATLGTLNINGAIAQNYRGIVGIIGTSGYVKNYVYDSRLKYASPPHFLDPVQSAFGPSLWTELTPAYTS